jgi:alkylmercury lyase
MQHPPLDMIAEHLAEQLHGEQDTLCLHILHQVTHGKPVTQASLQASLQISQDELGRRLLHLPDTEFDQSGNIVGWGVTLLPTPHRFQVRGKPLFTWCAFDTVLFPPSLLISAQVQSRCPVTGHPITFIAMPEGVVNDLLPSGSVMSLILPEQRSDCVRGTFCQQSLFFQSEQAASTFLDAHPEAVLLSVEEAAYVGRLVAEMRFTEKG